MFIAERQGFEPWEQLPVHRISSAARSTTPASLLDFSRCKGNGFCNKLYAFGRFFSEAGMFFFAFLSCILLRVGVRGTAGAVRKRRRREGRQ